MQFLFHNIIKQVKCRLKTVVYFVKNIKPDKLVQDGNIARTDRRLKMALMSPYMQSTAIVSSAMRLIPGLRKKSIMAFWRATGPTLSVKFMNAERLSR